MSTNVKLCPRKENKSTLYLHILSNKSRLNIAKILTCQLKSCHIYIAYTLFHNGEKNTPIEYIFVRVCRS